MRFEVAAWLEVTLAAFAILLAAALSWTLRTSDTSVWLGVAGVLFTGRFLLR